MIAGRGFENVHRDPAETSDSLEQFVEKSKTEILKTSGCALPLVITERGDAERAKGGTPGDSVPQRLPVEQSGKEPCAERVSSANGINFRNRVARAKTAFRTVGVPSAFVAGLQGAIVCIPQ